MTRLERLRRALALARLCDDRAPVETDDLAALLAVADAAREAVAQRYPLPPMDRLAAALAALDGAAEAADDGPMKRPEVPGE